MNQLELLFHCFRHFAHLDQSNAAVHCSPVRYSPITFRLMEELEGHDMKAFMFDVREDDLVGAQLWHDVKAHAGKYREDIGRVELDRG